jgi:hypothetical protein
MVQGNHKEITMATAQFPAKEVRQACMRRLADLETEIQAYLNKGHERYERHVDAGMWSHSIWTPCTVVDRVIRQIRDMQTMAELSEGRDMLLEPGEVTMIFQRHKPSDGSDLI